MYTSDAMEPPRLCWDCLCHLFAGAQLGLVLPPKLPPTLDRASLKQRENVDSHRGRGLVGCLEDP